jgi:hypothetical protein
MELVKIEEGLRLRGEVRVHVFDGDLPPLTGHELVRFLDAREPTSVYTNMVTDLGRAQMTKLLVGESADQFGYIGLSTSATTPSLTATALPNEIARKACSVIQSIATYYQRRIAYFSTTDFNSTGIVGAGGFDTTSTGGTMWTIASISLSKTNAQAATVEWRILSSS